MYLTKNFVTTWTKQIWFAAKETVKNKASEEPTAADEHVVDLRKAINEPMGSNDYNKVDLRSAIQQ